MWDLQDIQRILIMLEMNQEWKHIDKEIWVSFKYGCFSWNLTIVFLVFVGMKLRIWWTFE